MAACNALFDHVMPYFRVPRQLLLDYGKEFMSQIWDKFLQVLGIQQLLTFSYHSEGNGINEWSYCTINNILHTSLQDGTLYHIG